MSASAGTGAVIPPSKKTANTATSSTKRMPRIILHPKGRSPVYSSSDSNRASATPPVVLPEFARGAPVSAASTVPSRQTPRNPQPPQRDDQLAAIQNKLEVMHEDLKKLQQQPAATVATTNKPHPPAAAIVEPRSNGAAHVHIMSPNDSTHSPPKCAMNNGGSLKPSLAPEPPKPTASLKPSIGADAPKPAAATLKPPTAAPAAVSMTAPAAPAAPPAGKRIAPAAGGAARGQKSMFGADVVHVATPDTSSCSDSDSDDDSDFSGAGSAPDTSNRLAAAIMGSLAPVTGGGGGGGLSGTTSGGMREGIRFQEKGSTGDVGASLPRPRQGRGIQMFEEQPSSVDGSRPQSAANDGRRTSLPSGRRSLFPGEVSNTDLHDNAKAVDSNEVNTRKENEAVRVLRESFFQPIPRLEDILNGATDDNEARDRILLPGAPCSWLCCISLAISFVSGVPTSIERVLKTNHLGVHYIALPAITLAEQFDLVNDYIHTCFHRNNANNAHCSEEEFEEDEDGVKHLSAEQQRRLQHLHCEMATFDTEVIDLEELDEDKQLGMGEHAPVTSLAQFRKELTTYVNDKHSLFIFNYDQYVIEEYHAHLKSNMAETEEEAAAIMSSMRNKPNASFGTFGILLDFNPVRNTVTIVTPHLSQEQHATKFTDRPSSSSRIFTADEQEKRFGRVFANIILEESTVSVQCMYDAVCVKDRYTQLSRGFVRVFINENFSTKLPSIFPLFVLDGSSSAGLVTTVLDVSIAPHVLGLAIVHNLTITFLLSDSARRKQSSRNLLNRANVCDVKLRGIPLTKIVQQLRLPISMIVGSSGKDSIAMSFAWYHVFLQQMQVSQEVRLGLVLPARRGGAADGQPNVDEDEFMSHLKSVVESSSVMLISFDVNIAQNVKITSRAEPAHFAIVIGLDEERGIVRLADVNVKRFRKTWHIPFYRLYNAVMGYGYMVATKDKQVIKQLGGKRFRQQALSCGRYALPPVTAQPPRFEYPAKPYAITVLADALERMGFPADVERCLNFSGFHISYFLSKHMPLEALAMVGRNFSHHALDDAVTVTTTHFDYHEGRLPPNEVDPYNPVNKKHRLSVVEDLQEAIVHALANPSTRQLIVRIDHSVLAAAKEVWNGSANGGVYGIVVHYDERTNFVTVQDCNISSYHRTWAVPLPLLFTAVCSMDVEGQRAGGTILLSSDASQEEIYENTSGYDMAHAQVHHPFRPLFSSTCACLALAATELMLSIEAPRMLDGAPIAEEEQEKRKYRRYNNIFSAENFLYALPFFRVTEWHSEWASNMNVHARNIANTALNALRLPLEAVDLTEIYPTALSNPSVFLEACGGISGLMTITLISYDTDLMHGVPGGSMSVVNRVEASEDAASGSKGCIQLVSGDACRWGNTIECTVEELMPMVTAMLVIRERQGEAEA